MTRMLARGSRLLIPALLVILIGGCQKEAEPPPQGDSGQQPPPATAGDPAPADEVELEF